VKFLIATLFHKQMIYHNGNYHLHKSGEEITITSTHSKLQERNHSKANFRKEFISKVPRLQGWNNLFQKFENSKDSLFVLVLHFDVDLAIDDVVKGIILRENVTEGVLPDLHLSLGKNV